MIADNLHHFADEMQRAQAVLNQIESDARLAFRDIKARREAGYTQEELDKELAFHVSKFPTREASDLHVKVAAAIDQATVLLHRVQPGSREHLELGLNIDDYVDAKTNEVVIDRGALDATRRE